MANRALPLEIVVNYWLDRPVFVTGGSGLVGQWLLKALVKEKADVVCLVRDWRPQSELFGGDLISKVSVVRGELQDQALLERILGEYEVDTVFHLAAQTIATIANRNPISTFDSNIRGTWSLLEACRRSSLVKQIVIASSDKAYGEPETVPYTEDMPMCGNYPYDVSKSCADLIAQTYANTYNLPVAISRCANFYGGGDLNWNRIVPGTIRSVIRGQRPVIRSDGTPIRDFFYVEDGIAAYMLLAQKASAWKGEAFNFSAENPQTVLSFTQEIIRMMGSDLEPEILGDAPHEIQRQYLGSAKARELLDWEPLFSQTEGLQRTIDWYKRFFG